MKIHPAVTLFLLCYLCVWPAASQADTDQDDLVGSALVSRASTMAERTMEIRGTGTELRQVSLNVYGSDRSSGVGLGIYGMVLSQGGTAGFKQSFTLPENYQPGTPIGVRMLWHMGGAGGVSCFVEMWGDFVNILRPGLTRTGSQFQFSNGNFWMPLFTPATTLEEVVETIVWIPGEAGSPVQAIPAGSSITFGLFRDNGVNDTCAGDMTIGGLSVVYQAVTDEVFRDRFQSTP